MELLADEAALQRIGADDIALLTRRATAATFYTDDLSAEQIAANRRIVDISADTAIAACSDDRRHFIAAFVDGRFAGYMIATLHAPDDREFDWLMVDPDFHGTPVARTLTLSGIAWLDPRLPMWLNVIQHNGRAIAFYRKHGFEIDPLTTTDHVVPHHIMRRAPAPLPELHSN